jgi:pimeloyl-ACP methyl ester carboxylesterase
MKQIRRLLPALLLVTSAFAANVTGRWNGSIDAGGKPTRFVLIVTEESGGVLKASLELPEMGGVKLPLDRFTKDAAGAVVFEVRISSAEYAGKLSADGKEIAGEWKQSGAVLPLTFYRPGYEPLRKELPPEKRGLLTMKPCGPAFHEDQELCGKYDVFEDRAAKSGRKISLNVHLLPALTPRPLPDAVFALAGGPGQSAVQAYIVHPAMQRLRARRDIVLIDQRGTGKSNGLTCDGLFANAQSMFDDVPMMDKLKDCREKLKKIADLNLYSSDFAMDDVDEVRQALGYDRINIYGGSYGTTAALVYLRRHGDHVRTATLKGVAPLDYKIPLAFAKTVQSSVEYLFNGCAADAECNKDFPDLRGDFNAALKQFDNGPVTAEVVNLTTKTAENIKLTQTAFVSHLRALLYIPDAVGSLPLMIHLAAQKEFGMFTTTLKTLVDAIGGAMSMGMEMSVICSEDVPFITEAEIKAETGGTWMGAQPIRDMQKVCAMWSVRKAPDSFIKPVSSDLPVLILSGDYDPATPPSVAERIVPYLPNSRHVVLKNSTHGSESGCIADLVAAFVDAGSAKDIDTSCSDQGKFPAFLTLEKLKALMGDTKGK